MKRKIKLHLAITAAIAIFVVIAVTVMCTSVLGHVLNGAKPFQPDNKNTSLVSYDFSDTGDSWIENGCICYEDMYVTLSDNPYFDGGINKNAENPYFYFKCDAVATDSSFWYEHHGYIGDYIDIGGSLCHVMDVDVELINFVEGVELALRPGYLTADGGLGGTSGTFARFYSGVKLCDLNGNVFADNLPEKFHYTYVFWADGRADIYVEGKLVHSIDKAFADNCTNYRGLRVNLVYDGSVLTANPEVRLDNLKFKTFGEDYEGYINYLYNNPDVDLHYVKDTVLGGGY